MNFSTDMISSITRTSLKKDTPVDHLPISNLYESIIDNEMKYNVMMEAMFNNMDETIDPSKAKELLSEILYQFIDSLKDMINKMIKITFNQEELIDKKKIKGYINSYNKEDYEKYSKRYQRKNVKYLNLNVEKSYTSLKILVDKELSGLISTIREINGLDDSNKTASIANDYLIRIDNIDNQMNDIRSSALGLNGSISKEQFNVNIYNYFRVIDSLDPVFVPSKSKLEEIFDEYYNYDKYSVLLNKHLVKFTKDIEELLREIEDIEFKDNKDNGYANIATQTVLYYKCLKIKEICDMYAILFASKIDAIVEYINFCKSVLLDLDNINNGILSEIEKEESLDESYDLFLEEQSLYKDILSKIFNIRDESFQNESGNDFILEAVTDRISKYLDKVFLSINTKYDKFIEKTTMEDDLFKSYSTIIGKYGKSFKLKGLPEYDLVKLSQVEVSPFNYVDNQTIYKSKREYYRNRYNNLYNIDNNYIGRAIRKSTFQKSANTTMNKDSLLKLLNFVYKDIKVEADKVKADIDTLSNNAKLITNIISSSVDVQEFFNSFVTDSKIDNLRIVSEAPENKKEENNTNTRNFSNSSFLKAVVVYMKLNCEIISAKMKILNDLYSNYMKVINHI